MGKYDYNETQDNPLKFECYIKTAIANELAEANRLKRLEIKMRIKEFNRPTIGTHEISDEELEDCA